MNRRQFLLATAAAASVGAVRGTAESDSADDPLDVSVWFSERAADHANLRDRVVGYLGRAFQEAGRDLSVSFGDAPVSLPSEGGRRVMTVTWPRLVLQGAAGIGPIDPADDVTLLVTDGSVRADHAGYATRHVAAMGGARLLAATPPAADTAAVVDYSAPAAVVQLLLHECGHALGLTHDQGTVAVRGDVVVATPMIGSYAWSPDDAPAAPRGRGENACGVGYPPVAGKKRQLALSYGACAGRAVRRYRGRLLG